MKCILKSLGKGRAVIWYEIIAYTSNKQTNMISSLICFDKNINQLLKDTGLDHKYFSRIYQAFAHDRKL